MFVPKRPWWQFWRVICWRHLVVVATYDACRKCLAEARSRNKFGPETCSKCGKAATIAYFCDGCFDEECRKRGVVHPANIMDPGNENHPLRRFLGDRRD